jgi:hypothetical protein
MIFSQVPRDPEKISPLEEKKLTMAESYAAFGQVVRGKLKRDFVAGQNANAVTTKPAGEMGQHHSLMLELNTEQTARKFLKDGSGYFYAVFLTHSTSVKDRFIRYRSVLARPPARVYSKTCSFFPAARLSLTGAGAEGYAVSISQKLYSGPGIAFEE